VARTVRTWGPSAQLPKRPKCGRRRRVRSPLMLGPSAPGGFSLWPRSISTLCERDVAVKDLPAGHVGTWRPMLLGRRPHRQTHDMVNDTDRNRAIYQALKAADEVAAALQAHLIEEHGGDLDRGALPNSSTNSLTLLRQARERLGEGLQAVGPGVAKSDHISLRNDAG
jgi:hypothetical protein